MDEWSAEQAEALERELQALLAELGASDRTRREALDQFRLAEAVFTHSVSGLAVLDRNYNFLRINEAYARDTRRPPGDLVGRNHFELYPSEAKAIFDEVVRTRRPFTTFTRPFIFPDQPERGVTYWDWTLVPILDQRGEVELLILSLVDVTERKRAEEALRESEARYRRQAAELELIYRTAPVGLCVFDTDLRYVHINERLAQFNGLPAAAHLGKTVREVVPDIADRAEAILRRVLESGEPVLDIEVSGEPPAQPGVQRTWRSEYWPLRDADGHVIGINAVVEEVTDRRQVEELRRREQEFRALAENSTDIVARFDRTLRRVYVNPAIEQILNRPRPEILGKTHREMGLPSAVADALDGELQAVLASGKPRSVEDTVPTPTGTRYLDSRLVPEFGADGQVVSVLAISRDITERKQAERALEAHARAQDFLVDTALRLLEPMGRAELFDFVTERIYALADGGLVLFNEFDPDGRRTILQGLGSTAEERITTHRLFGRDPVGITMEFPESIRGRLLPGELERLAGGVCELAFWQLPPELCQALERELRITSVYAMACSVEQDLLGTVGVLTHGEELRNKRLIETIVTQAALALKRLRAEETLQSERNFFNTVYDTQGAVVAILDPRYRVVRLNRAYQEVTGFSPGTMVGKSFRELMDPRSTDAMERQLGGLPTRPLAGEIETRVCTRDGTTRHLSWRTTLLRNDAGEVIDVIATGIDVTDRRRMEERTRHLAEHDPLTNLPNRRLLHELLESELRKAQRTQRKFALLFLDLDRFKAINDSLGHTVGDALLKEVARRLLDRARRSDVVARLGGDEFTLLLSELAQGQQAGDVAAAIIRTFRHPFQVAGQSLYITTSIGISLYPDDSDTAEGLLRCADLAMYDAKEQGRNTYRFYNRAVDRYARERMRIENSLRQALESEGLRVLYQPEIDLRTGRMVSVEALVRWQHPELGMLDPIRFVPVAEATGLISALDDWVLRTTCTQARRWLDQGFSPLRMSVNLSAKRFENPDLVDSVQRNLSESGLGAEHLELELTESTAMHHIDYTVERMRELVEMGVGIAIDDFGTGYSSLSYLKRLPIGKLKIDQSFVRDITTDADDRAIVNAVTALAHTLNLRVIAEGVETDAQRRFLVNIGCDEGQGFLFAKPLPPEQIQTLRTP